MVTLDLRGEICPYTMVRTKLALEELAPGETLVVLVDHAPAAEDVPRSCRREGHEILAVEAPAPGLWRIHIRRSP